MDAFRALVMDLGFAARTLRKNVAFTAAALATLTVGIGITGAVFTVVNGVLLRPLPYHDPSRIEMIFLSSSRAGYGNEIPLSIGFFADLQANQKSFSGVAAFQPWTPSLSDGAKTELVSAARVTTSLFGVLGIRPAFGRTFNDADGEPGAADVALVSHALWQRRFGGDPSVVGRRIDLGSKSFTIIGIMPPGFAFPRGAELPALTQFSARTDVWAPLAFTKADRGEYRVLSTLAIGRLAPDVTVQHARADLAGVIEASLKAHPRRTPLAYDLIDMQAQAGRHISNTLLFLMGSVVLVLLIACANVTNLLVARTATRRREFAVRAALGAGRARIARQLVAENLLLGAVGTGLGIVVSMAATRAMLSLVPGSLPRADDVTVDWRVVALAGVIAIFVGSVLGLVSALHVRQRNLSATLRDAGARSTVRGRGTARSLLVMAEISLSVMLIIGAVLLTSSFIRLQHVELGFVPRNVLTAPVVVPIPPEEDRDGKRFGDPMFSRLYAQLVDRLSRTPGVASVAASTTVPLTFSGSLSGVRIAGEPIPDAGTVPLSEFGIIEGDYFRTLGIKLIAGRTLDGRDQATSVPVIVVNRQFERAYLGGQALGKQLLTPFDLTNGTVPRTIVGVVDDVSSTTMDEPPKPQVYLPEQQLPASSLFLVARTQGGDPMTLLPLVRRELAALDPRSAVGDPTTLERIVSDSFARQRFSMTIMTVFAASALFLTVVGLYGVIVLSVNERRREIGVRMALGARSRDVLRMILGEGARIASIGIVLGLFGAFALSRVVRSMLFGVSATNPAIYAASAAAIAVVALVATYAPARRAAGVDPARILRGD